MNPFWEYNISRQECKKVLKKPGDRRFVPYLARLLSYVPAAKVFRYYITPRQFKKHYPRVRKLVDADPVGAGRLEFWNWLYKKL